MTDTRFDVLGVGNAIVDVLASVDDAFIEQHGLAKDAMLLIDEERAEALYEAFPPAQEISGGSAANSLAGVASLGVRGAYIGKVADDQLGEVFAHDLRSIGVHYDTKPLKDGPSTARCLIAVPADARRAMNTFLGASTMMDEDDINAYLATLAPYGATYHDIGMIWGGRLISPTGLFASENADTDGSERARHLIFLTDGQTEPYDMAYGAYGVEGLDERRWTPSSALTLAETVEARFSVACTEVKKRNVTVWVIAFGTHLNDSMLQCAGEGQYFEASNAEELNNAFTSIAKSIGDLRISE